MGRWVGLLGLLAALALGGCRPLDLGEWRLQGEPGEALWLELLLPKGLEGAEVCLQGPKGLVAPGWVGPGGLGYRLELLGPGKRGLVLWVGEGVAPGAYPLRLFLHRGGRSVAEARLVLTVSPPIPKGDADWRPVAPNLYRVVFQGGFFLALGDEGALLTSPDGQRWTPRTLPTRAKLFGAAWGGRWVAVGQDGVLLLSEDGVGWQQVPSPTSDWLYGVAYGGGRFVAGGTGARLWVSEEGVAWRPVPLPEPGLTLQALVWAPGGFVAVGLQGAVLRSPDGLAWERAPTGTSGHLRDVAFTPLGYVAVGDGGLVLLSNGREWRSRRVGEEDLVGVAYGEGLLLVVGAKGGVYASPDGVLWSPLPPLPVALSGVAYGHRRFVAVGYAGAILTSP